MIFAMGILTLCLFLFDFHILHDTLKSHCILTSALPPFQSTGPRKKPRLAAQGGSGASGAGGASSAAASNSHRLVRASKTFSSSDTLREVQNFVSTMAVHCSVISFILVMFLSLIYSFCVSYPFRLCLVSLLFVGSSIPFVSLICVSRPQIAERTGIWPMLQTLWVCGESQEGDDALIQITDDHRAMTLNALRVRPGDTIYFRAAVSAPLGSSCASCSRQVPVVYDRHGNCFYTITRRIIRF